MAGKDACFFFLVGVRRLCLTCRVHKRLPVRDPLSIHDQSARRSNYCKFVRVSSSRESGREREKVGREGIAASSSDIISTYSC